MIGVVCLNKQVCRSREVQQREQLDKQGLTGQSKGLCFI